MGKVYQVSSVNETVYFDTAKEAKRHKYIWGGGEADEIEMREVACLSAAGECNRLSRIVGETESELYKVRYDLTKLLDDVSGESQRQTIRYSINRIEKIFEEYGVTFPE